MKKKKKRKKIKIKFRLVLVFLLFLYIIVTAILYLIKLPISNIYIKGNLYLTDQEVIEEAHIENYPSTFKNLSHTIKKRLEKNKYIKEAKVSKKLLTEVSIEIIENRPLFFNQSLNKVVLLDKKETDDSFNVPTLINYIPDVIYNTFIDKMGKVDINILNKISEIKYNPDEVDDSRFLFTMTDSNYVYVTLNKLERINNYNDIVKQFDNKKGILYLNSGGYFEIVK